MTDIIDFPEYPQLGEAIKIREIVVVQGKVKNATDIEAGQLVCNDGDGFVPATTALAATQTVFVSAEKQVYTEEEAEDKPEKEKHMIGMYAQGVVVAMKDTGALVKGQKLTVGATGKAVAVADETEVVIGSACLDAASADDRVIIRLGQ